MNDTKVCRDCGVEKSLDDFYPKSSYCKSCHLVRGERNRLERERPERERRREEKRQRLNSGVKQCRLCKQTFPLDHFYFSKDSLDGRVGRCKPCHGVSSHLSRDPQIPAPTADERFATFIEADLASDCLLWTGGDAMNFWFEGSNVAARRYVLMREGIMIPDEMKVVDTCGNGRCVRWSHLTQRRKGNGVRHDTKICSDCGVEKNLGEFSPCATGSRGRFNYCKPCFRERKRKEYQNKTKRERNVLVLARYGLTLESFDEMFRRQEGLCAICGGIGGIHGLVVDHDHSSGIVRQLLCASCNAGIAMLKHDSAVMAAAIEYVEKWNASISTSLSGSIHVASATSK